MKRIIKTAGYCSDGCQWNFCDYYKLLEEVVPFDSDCSIVKRTQHICTMFGNTELSSGGSLKVCNKVYGANYEGEP